MNGRQHPVSATRGSVLLYLIAVMTIVGVLAAAMLKLSVTSRETLFSANSMNQAQFLAESGLRIAQSRYCAEGELQTPLTITLDLGKVEIVEQGETHFRATATAFPGTPLEARAEAFGLIPTCSSGAPVIPGDSPDDYVILSANKEFFLPSGTIVDGSIFAKKVTTESKVNITGNVISSTSITLGSGSTVGGFIYGPSGDVIISSSDSEILGNIYAPHGKVEIGGSNTVIWGDIYSEKEVNLQPIGHKIKGDIHAGGDVSIGSGVEVWKSVFSKRRVELKASNSMVFEDIHSGKDVILNSGTGVFGNVFSAESVTLRNSGSFIDENTHTGADYISNRGTSGGSVYAAGLIQLNDSTISGNAFAGRNILADSAAIKGQSSSFSSPTIIPPFAPISASHFPPPLPLEPELQTFAPGSTIVSVSSSGTKVDPGVYGRLNFLNAGKATLTSGSCSQTGNPGCYIFESIGPEDWNSEIHLDLSVPGNIVVLVKNELHFRGIVKVSIDGTNFIPIRDVDPTIAKELSKRVYWETHHTFKAREWFGTILSKNSMDLHSSFFGVGALATLDGEIKMGGGQANITYVLADFAKIHWRQN